MQRNSIRLVLFRSVVLTLVIWSPVFRFGSLPVVHADEGIPKERIETAIFAGGCFWSIEPVFEKLPGVIQVESGYTGGRLENPTYEDVSHSNTGHVEAVRVKFDSLAIAYADLLEIFWRNIDPTDDGGQFVDRGASYKTVIFTSGEKQQLAAEASKKLLEQSGRFQHPIRTAIRPAAVFYLAEEYHQNFYRTNPRRYEACRIGSGREEFVQTIWGDDREYMIQQSRMNTRSVSSSKEVPKYRKPDDAELRRRLTPMQYDVTQNDGTEPAFRNEYWNNAEKGIYVDIVTGEPLFSSNEMFHSGTGWPSFYRPIEAECVVEKSDRSLFDDRTEVRSKYGDSHLGHVFDDGPKPTGLRYCINSAALRFVPASKLRAEGYEQYLPRFQSNR